MADTPDIKQYLDECIALWRDIRDGKMPAPPERRGMAPLYVDALQSVRLFVCGELLGEVEDPTRIPDSPGPNVVELRSVVERHGSLVEGAPLWTSEEVHELALMALGRISVDLAQPGGEAADRPDFDYILTRGGEPIGYGEVAKRYEDALRAEITERCASPS